MKIAIYNVLFLTVFGLALARPQRNFIIDTGSSVEEVIRPEEKRQIFNEFQGRSILYKSLPDFVEGNVREEVIVESPVLVLTKPKDRDAKRREKAERRTQELN